MELTALNITLNGQNVVGHFIMSVSQFQKTPSHLFLKYKTNVHIYWVFLFFPQLNFGVFSEQKYKTRLLSAEFRSKLY